jgi:hypothetical protein
MAFVAANVDTTIFGDKRVVLGSYVNTGGSTGGKITTGLNAIVAFMLQPYGTSVASMAVVNGSVPTSTVPVADGITIVTNANESGIWMAYGW